MPNFRVNGSTGQAPTTSWLGAIPDRGFTLLSPRHYDSASNTILTDSFGPANYINLWTPYNTFVATGSGTNAPTVSVGATTTAPDGTSSGNASHITEAANTGVHSMIAQTPPMDTLIQGGGWTMRLAAIAKAAERTRIALTINSSGSAAGSQTVFDLAGVQIGVANTVFNSGGYATPIAGPATITSLGNGWCLCMMDVYFPYGQNAYQGLEASFNLDAGSGTGALNISYAGDGTSGVYAWRTSMLPAVTWAMSGAAIFHDDFDSIGTIDVNNTLAPGYKWYTNNIWPAGGWTNTVDHVTPTPSSEISVASSILSLQQRPTSNPMQLQEQLNTCAALPGGVASEHATSFVGQGFLPPLLLEVKVSLDALPSSGAQPYLHWFAGPSLLGIPYPTFPPGTEVDCFNQGGYTASAVGGALFTWNEGVPPGYFEFARWSLWGGAVGYGIWNPVINYASNNNDVVYFSGSYYQALNLLPTNNLNKPPDVNPTLWGLVSPYPPSTQLNSYDIYDPTLFNVYNTLVLPNSVNAAGYPEIGWMLNWFNQAPINAMPSGGGANMGTAYSPALSGHFGFKDSTGYIQRWTVDPMALILFAGISDTQAPAQFDYVTVMQ